MLTIEPSFFASSGAACCEMNSGARRLEPISSSQCEGSDPADRHREKRRGVVDQHVEAAEALERAADQRPRRDRRQQLRLHLGGAARALRVQLAFELGGVGLGTAVMEQHVRAGGVQPPCDRRADAPPAAGHERHLACSESMKSMILG